MQNIGENKQLNLFSKTDKIVFSIFGIIILAALAWKTMSPGKSKKEETQPVTQNSKKDKGSTNSKKQKAEVASEVSIVQKWDMSSELKEISGLSYMDDERMVCVQDELGTIFIFNRKSNTIENKIPFAKKGDYEGVAIKDSTVYVVRADGHLYEVDIAASRKNAIKEYKTSLTIEHNVEGLCFDKDNNRLLLAIKDNEPGKPGYKGIYAFDLGNKTFINEPVYKISLNHDVLKKGSKKSVMPSAIAVHPSTGEIFITDGPQSGLLVMDKNGDIKKFIDLGKEFSQPEGITFSPAGELFISNEGTKLPGNILQVRI